jgi:hypothetical protein
LIIVPQARTVSGREASRLESASCALACLFLLDPLHDFDETFQRHNYLLENWDCDPANVAPCGGAQVWLALKERFQFPVKSPAVSFEVALLGAGVKFP